MNSPEAVQTEPKNKPNFLIIGAQKAGSTWLAQQLSQHPQVYVHPKEIHYFDKDDNYGRGPGWYFPHFDSAGTATAIGEKTPDYFWPNGHGCEGHLPNVHRNIAALLPNAKLIVILRDPVKRALSAARHLIVTGRVSPRVSATALLCGNYREVGQSHGLIEYGHYADHLRAFYKLFAPEQIHVIFFEDDVVEAPERTLSRTCKFLGVDDEYRFEHVRKKKNEMRTTRAALFLRFYGPYLYRLLRPLDKWALPPFRNNFRARLDPECIQSLTDHFAARNLELFTLLGRHSKHWLPARRNET